MSASSWRSSPLPPGWAKLREKVLLRDGYRCQHVLTAGGICGERAREVDHTGAANDHRPEVLRSLCTYHHRQKTAREAGRASAARRIPRNRPPERHPGLID